ncbi:MAG: c-type cytochrome [Planctomycetes bacterium]|nr:c-type cytochrome [Planctomycetota bacterium]
MGNGGALLYLLAEILAQGAAGGPLAPEEALRSFQLEPGLRIELVACEPLVVDPVALAFDERGRLYAAENRDYPTGPGAGMPPGGRIALLEDLDGDGRFEKRTDFAAGLTFPNGLLPWKGGLLVTCAPDLLYLKDADGDGRADTRQVLLTGFSTGGSTQLRASHPTLGPDGWIYLTSGLTGGKVVCPDRPERPALETREDVRFHPETLECEAAGGGGQFGLTFDDFGRRFVCYNRVQVQHVVLSPRALKRNPYLAFSETLQDCPDLEANPLLRGGGGAARLYPISANITTADSHVGTFTAACGVLIYRGVALPEEYRGCAFSCDPTGNLVHYDRLDPDGATFAARRVRDKVEFLASRDDWFRPVFLGNGPDGALYVCDIYRKTIEHPDYLPEEIRKRADFESGKGLGRIYRVTGEKIGAGARVKSPAPQGAAIDELVLGLEHPEGWQRDAAFRLLVERRDKTAIPLLKAALKKPLSAASMAAALFALEVLDGLEEEIIRKAMESKVPQVREVAARLCEPYLSSSGKLARLARTRDVYARVRFQCALALGSASGELAVACLSQIAARDANDRWIRAAVLSSAGGREGELLEQLLRSPDLSRPGFLLLLAELGKMVGTRAQDADLAGALRKLLEMSAPAEGSCRIALLNGFASSARGRGEGSGLASLAGAGAGPQLEAMLEQAMAQAADAKEAVPLRINAISFLAHASPEKVLPALLALLDSKEPAELRIAAVRALGELKDAGAARELLVPERWKAYPPPLRNAALAAVLSHEVHLPGLLQAVEDGTVPAGAVEAARRGQLLQHQKESIRRRAEKLFKSPGPGDRRKVYEEYKPVLALKPAPANGREVFKRLCAQCHRLDREGVPVGPDLFDIRSQPKESILLHLLVPEYEMLPGFTGYLVQTRDGRSLTGLISSETPASITLRQAQGIEETILRQNIASLVSSNLSLMPQELEKSMTHQELADLLAYLKGES